MTEILPCQPLSAEGAHLSARGGSAFQGLPRFSLTINDSNLRETQARLFRRVLWLDYQYRVELYPHVPGLGIGSGIRDKYGNELKFPAAFRQCRRNGKPRGIVKIKYGGQL